MALYFEICLSLTMTTDRFTFLKDRSLQTIFFIKVLYCVYYAEHKHAYPILDHSFARIVVGTKTYSEKTMSSFVAMRNALAVITVKAIHSLH